MSGAYTATGFDYDNYSNGRWGFHVGTQFGKQFEKISVAAFAEVLRTFGNDNNSIELVSIDTESPMGILNRAQLTALGFPSEISVDLKSATEVNAGLKAFYQMNDKWSFGTSFTYKHHADNGVEGLATELKTLPSPYAAQQAALVKGLLEKTEDMNDGFDEYVFGLSAAYQMTDTTQVAVYGEYTLDTAHEQSQNGTDVKAEMGVRLNVQF
jgi:hypothetical protein